MNARALRGVRHARVTARRPTIRRRPLTLRAIVRRMRWSDRLHDKRHRFEVVATWRAWEWQRCRACGLWARRMTDEGRRRATKRMVAVTRRAFIPGLIRSIYRPSPILATLLS